MKSLLLLLAMGTVVANAEEHAHHADALPSIDAQIVVTINPEARISAILGAPLPAPIACGSPTEIKVEVINKAFVTAPLRAAIIGSSSRQLSLHMDDTKLNGQPEDNRVLQLVPLGPSLVDVTIAFSIDYNIRDLGGRDRVHFLLRCQ